MKRNSNLIIGLVCLILFVIFISDIANSAEVYKWLRVGRLRVKVWEDGSQSETSNMNMACYYYPHSRNRYFYNTRFLLCAGSRWGCSDWTDENDKYYPVKLAGTPYGSADNPDNTWGLELEPGIKIKRYFRYTPPTVVVDGNILNEPFPQIGDELAPDKVFGNADVMTETHLRNWMGLDITARVLAWSQHNHDDYAVWDWTATNVGNIDHDDEVELPNQTLTGLYFMRQGEYFVCRSMKEWTGVYGQHPGDSLRIMYNYGATRKKWNFDRVGYPETGKGGRLQQPIYGGEVAIHVDKSYNDETDDLAQPQMHSQSGPDDLFLKHESGRRGEAEWLTAYSIMQIGYHDYWSVPYEEGCYPGTHHDLPMELRGEAFVEDFDEWWFWHQVINNASGPFTLPPGEDLHFVWASVGGSISERLGWDVGTAWYEDSAEPPPGMVYGVTDNMPPQYKLHPSLYDNPTYRYAGAYSNWAKDCWVMTGKDTLFRNAYNAQENYKMNYEIPIPPDPPSVEIKSLPDRVRIEWDGTESEKASDFAGYRVYRAVPTSDSCFFHMIYEVTGKGTNYFEDTDAARGVGYIYYVTAFDDGIGNKVDVNGKKEVLESGKWLNITDMQSAYLTRPPGTALSDIRVVPNPYNIVLGEAGMHYPGEENKIMFLDLPGYCTIKIYTESGDLVKTLYHTDGSGDEAWGVLETEHMASESEQIVVSGIYIALIEETNIEGTPTGERQFVKFVIVR